MPHEKFKPSYTFNEDRLKRLQEIIPEIFADEKINWETLREALGEHLEEEGSNVEHFGLVWPGKKKARQIASIPSKGTLVPVPGEGVNEENTGNIIIEGENLEVLKLLQKSYAGRIKMIYIDPPYNTGNDFIYNDDFADPVAEYLKMTGQMDEEGRALTTNKKSDGRFHSRWLSMMYPRLLLARTLLRDDGVIFISINDEEADKLKLLSTEIFGERCFIAQLVWNNEGNIDNQSKIKTAHEYVLMYGKTAEGFAKPIVIDPNIEETSKLYNDTIENSIIKNGPANPPSVVRLPVGFPSVKEELVLEPRNSPWPKILDQIVVKSGRLTRSARVESGWSSKNLFELYISNGCQPIFDAEGKGTWFALTKTGAIYGYKTRSSTQGHVLSVIRNVGTTKQNSNMLSSWGLNFSYPKPERLIRYLVEIATRQDPEAKILDFFAGSGTTAHATLELNNDDGGNRKFILVQLPEATGREDYPTIARITKERLRRVIAKLEKENEGKLLDDKKQDRGFKVFKLARTHFEEWGGYEGEDVRELETLFSQQETTLTDGWKPENLLVEVLLQEGFPLDSRVEKAAALKKNEVLVVSSGACAHRLLVCFDKIIHQDTVRDLQRKEEDIFICLDSALTDAQKVAMSDAGYLKTI